MGEREGVGRGGGGRGEAGRGTEAREAWHVGLPQLGTEEVLAQLTEAPCVASSGASRLLTASGSCQKRARPSNRVHLLKGLAAGVHRRRGGERRR